MKFDDMGLTFPQECLRAALLVSLLSVWVLVGLFYYLNRYTRQQYFSIWTGAWLFYAMWLTAGSGRANRLGSGCVLGKPPHRQELSNLLFQVTGGSAC